MTILCLTKSITWSSKSARPRGFPRHNLCHSTASYQQPPKKDLKSSTVIFHPSTHIYQIQSSFFATLSKGMFSNGRNWYAAPTTTPRGG